MCFLHISISKIYLEKNKFSSLIQSRNHINIRQWLQKLSNVVCWKNDDGTEREIISFIRKTSEEELFHFRFYFISYFYINNFLWTVFRFFCLWDFLGVCLRAFQEVKFTLLKKKVENLDVTKVDNLTRCENIHQKQKTITQTRINLIQIGFKVWITKSCVGF